MTRPSFDQLARDALDDIGVADSCDRVGIGEAQNHQEPMPS